ncbi:hypothetical protein M9Y10_003058 [Tritrichomonas musculus]|uniref:Uncharacterized protein n=1 Tax=Tritrichomonas musculus TaxID=1915356 RepID=A0ABR2JNJ9_9EUKA
MPIKRSVTDKDVEFIGYVTFPNLEQGKIHKYGKYRSKKDRKRYYLRCEEEVIDDNGVICRCRMPYERDDNFKTWLQNHVHECKPGIPKVQKSLYDYQTVGDQDESKKMTENHLHRQMAIFTGEMNLSLNTLTSESFYNLAINFISFGLYNAGVKNYREKAVNLFHPIKRDKLRYLMTTEAYQRHRTILDKFAKLSYVCVAMNEGTTAHNQNLHFVLEAPLSKITSYPFNVVKMDGGNTQCYLDSIPKGLLPLTILKIKIGSVVIDGNTAQKKAWNPDYKHSILYNQNIPNAQNIIVVPCLCHRVHNAYKRVAKSNDKLKKLVEMLHSISKICQEKQSFIGASCPQHLDNRWANDYDVVKFLINHKSKILIIQKDIPFDKLQELEKVLKIFKCLILRFENPKTRFASAFITLERAINCLYELENVHKVPFGKALSESLSKYTLEAKDGGIWGLGYSFTLEGRKDFIKRLQDKENPLEESYLEYFDLDYYLPYTDDVSSSNKELNPEEEVFMTEKGEPIELNDDTEPTSEDDDEGQKVSDNSTNNDEEDESILPIENAKLNQTKHITAAKKALEQILNTRNHKNKNLTQHHLRVYNSYLEPENDKYDIYINECLQFCWIQIRSEEENMGEIGDIAMRLLSACLSEASCERAISRQRIIHSNRRLRSKPDLLDARNILQSTH